MYILIQLYPYTHNNFTYLVYDENYVNNKECDF